MDVAQTNWTPAHCREKDAGKVLELAQAILKVKPRTLLSFALDIPKNTILKNLAGEVML